MASPAVIGPARPLGKEGAAAFGCFAAEAQDAEGLLAAFREAKQQMAADLVAVMNAVVQQE